MSLPKVLTDLDACTGRDGLGVFDCANDLELHEWIVNENSQIGKAS